MIKRKSVISAKPEKPKYDGPAPTKVPRGVKIDALPDAIVEGDFKPNVGDKVVVMRRRGASLSPSVCEVKKKGEGGLIELWDDTLHQWYPFTVDDAVKFGTVIKVLFTASPAGTA